MKKYQAFIGTDEVALVEHELLKGCDMMDAGERMLLYISGVHDMADRLIEVIKGAYPNMEGDS